MGLNLASKPYFVHLVAEIKCSFEEGNSVDWVSNKVKLLLNELDVQVLESSSRHFEPQGISQVYVLSASHIAVHTWPENEYLHLDLICCKEGVNLESFSDSIKKTFKDTANKTTELKY